MDLDLTLHSIQAMLDPKSKSHVLSAIVMSTGKALLSDLQKNDTALCTLSQH